MATARRNESMCNLVQVGTLKLEDERAKRHHQYISLVVLSPDKVMVVDYKASHLRLHSLQDGHLLAVSDSLESPPLDMCICSINDNEIQTAVSLDGQIQILSIKTTGQTATITQVRTLDVKKKFDSCDALKYLNEKLLVSGQKKDKMCWGIVSLTDGHVDKVHEICRCGKGYGNSWSYLSTNPRDDTMIYISCWAGDSYPNNTGVYGYRKSKREFLYQHDDLTKTYGMAVDTRGSIFLCNLRPPCIHHLSERGQLVNIYQKGIPLSPYAMFWEEPQGLLYVTCAKSNVIYIYRPEYSHQQDPAIPVEVLNMDTKSIDMYKQALKDGKEKVYSIRVMVVGQFGVGKTTLTKRILGKDVKISDRKSTEGINIHIDCCKVTLATGEWITQEKTDFQYSRLQRLVKLLSVQKLETSGNNEGTSEMDDHSTDKKYRADTSVPQVHPVQCMKTVRKSDLPPTEQQAQISTMNVDKIPKVKHSDQTTSTDTIPVREAGSSDSENKKDTVMEILHLVNENVEKLKHITEYATLTVWDFAGQYSFYTTHQTFLTSRAIYLLVIDINQQITDLIKDDQYFHDTEGIKRCKVHDIIEVWLNSIHTCATSSATGIPPVILVGTHVDKIPEKSRQKVIDKYFLKIRYMLNEKPTVLHLMDDIALDNTQCDPRLNDLRRKIFELASKQSHWGEEKPARWLPLEQAMMALKASGTKVVPLSLLEEINRSGSVTIEDRNELDLFLRFHHEIGTILYFSVDGLREKIVLDPQWLIDALKSLITAEEFIRINPTIIKGWCEFKGKGKLTEELINGIWTKEKNPEFHDNKEHILLLMEKLNIIARPRMYSEDGEEMRVENYFLAPCMLKEKTPKELISPKPRPGMESTPVLSYVFKDKFLPAPIFHRLLAACVAKWPISKNAMSENLIYCGSCAFDIDLHHRLVVFFREYIIFTRVTRMGTTQRTPSLKQCIHVREFIEMTLSKIIGYLGQSLQFELFVRCPKSDGYGVDCLIPVADLQKNVDVPCNFHVMKNSHLVTSHEVLKFWFQDEEIQGNPGHLLSDQGLMYVASRLGAEWKFVALNLHLTQAEIDRIQMDMPGQTLGQIHKALSTWLNRSIRKDHKNVLQLLNAIEDVKRNDLALELKEKFHVQD